MSLEDGLVMQIHPGSARNHNRKLYERYGRDVGADIPRPTNYVDALRPLLDRFGNERNLTIILFTLDESTYSRELAPLAGHYPCLRLGPPWWFHDSPEGMMRFRRAGHRDGGLLQYGWVQRRYARFPFHSRAARCGAAHGLRLPGQAGRRTPPGRRRSVRSSARTGLRTW